MALSFGIWDHFDSVPDVEPFRAYEDRIALVRRAEELGYFGYHLGEHHNSRLSMAPSPLLFLAALAVRTTTIGLGTLVLVAPGYPRLRLLEDVAVVDQLSKGRLLLGLGPGVRRTELAWLGADPATAREETAATLDALRRAFGEGVAVLRSTNGDSEAVTFRYRTYREAPLSLWWAGSPARAAALGASVIGAAGTHFSRSEVDAYWEAHAAVGGDAPWPDPSPKVGTARHVVVAETDAEALAIARRAWPVHADHVFEVPFEAGADTPAARGTIGMNVGEDADVVLARRVALVAGSAATVAEMLQEYLESVGPGHNYLVGLFQWGDISHEEAIQSIELFASDVMPQLAKTTKPPTVAAAAP